MKAALILAAVLASLPAHAKPWQCVLYPRTCDVLIPVPVPAPPEIRPEPPPVFVPAPVPLPPVVVQPAPAVAKPHHKPAAKPVKSKFKKVKKRYTAAELSAMPGLPWYWPCSKIRENAAGKTKAQLIAEGRARNISLNPRQIQQVCDCGVAAACEG